MHPKTLSVILLFTVFVLSSPALAQRVAPQVTVDASPTALSWGVGFSHQGARLTIAGPAGLRLTRSFKVGEALTFGLFDDKGQPLPDGAYTFELHAKRPLSAEEREIEAAGQQGGSMTPQEARQARADLESANGPFMIRKSGSFTVQGGQISGLGGQDKRVSGSRAEGKPIRNVTGADITDGGDIKAGGGLAAGSTTTFPDVGELELILGTDAERASVERFSSFLEISSLDDFNDLTIDVATGFVGIATATPATELHVVGFNETNLMLEDATSGDWYYLNQGEQGLWFSNPAALGALKLQNGAPANSLVVDPLGRVGIGTATPGGNLHIFGVGSTDVFNAVGPDPAPTGNSFNFGYSGASFGLASGFFNVRPAAGAVAPNPALYFMTGNVDRMMVDNQGFLGVHLDGTFGPGFNPAHPIHAQVSGAFLSAGGTWTNASSRALKKDVSPLSGEAAMSALQRLEPVNFTYRNEPEDPHVGFIAEDVPDIVATADRKSLAPMDIVAVLTRVVQEQQKTIETLMERVERLEGDGKP